MEEHFKAQLAEFRRDDEARWKYETAELERQIAIEQRLGRSDDTGKKELDKAGVNVNALEKESTRWAKKEARAHKELLEIEPPPRSRGRKERIKLDKVAALAGSHTWLYPPAYEGYGNSEACGFNLALGEFNIESDQTGDGWGLEAVAYGTQYCTLWFYYFPPFPGELLVEPHVDFQGNVAVSAHDHWYTSTHAELRLKLHFDLYQHYWDGEQTTTIIDEHRHNSSTAYWVNDHRIMSKSLSVSAHDIVWIKLTTSLFVKAHSSHAHVDVDFRTGASRRIRVEHIWLNLASVLAPLSVGELKVKA
jgi:hypothetical protein